MKSKIIVALLILCDFLFAQNYHDTQGKLEISNSGQAIFTLPIAMPQSIGGVGPTVNLTYSSGQLGGIAGQGWSISGMSVITRISTRLDTDGFIDGVDFDENDKLALDGQRLLVVSGDYWQDGSVYETEIQSNIRVELKIFNNNTYFIVTTPDGTKNWYGIEPGTYNSFHNGIDATSWYIVSTLDTDGNYIKYLYLRTTGTDIYYNLCIHEIQFGMNQNSNPDPINTISFTYRGLTPRNENYYLDGKKYLKTKTLDEIKVTTNSLTFKKYVISHSVDYELGYERVSQIQEFNGNDEPANPIIFEYDSTMTTNINSEIFKSYNNNINFADTHLTGDFDGDSRLDFVANNMLFTKAFEGEVSNFPISLTSEMTATLEPSFAATTLSGNKLNQSHSFIKTHRYDSSTILKVFDLTGTTFNNSYNKEIVIDNVGHYGTPTYEDIDCPQNDCMFIASQIISLPDPDYSTPWNVPCDLTSQVRNRQKYYEGDFNGDGISEVFIINEHIERKVHYKNYIGTSGGTWCNTNDEVIDVDYYLLDLNPHKSTVLGSSGYVQFTNQLLVSENFKFEERFFADFNGDAKTDMLIIDRNYSTYGHYKIFEFKQLTTAPWVELNVIGAGVIDRYAYGKVMLFGDYNGDGKTDIMLPETNGGSGHSIWHIYYSNPKSDAGELFEKESHNIVEYWPNTGGTYDTQVHTSSYYALDINKDGKTDLVRIWRKYYKPTPSINDHDTEWNITGYANNIGNAAFALGNKFTLSYISPCYYNSQGDEVCDHPHSSPELPTPITSSFRHNNMNHEIIMVRNHSNQVTYIDFKKDVSRDATLIKVTQSNGAIINEITYDELESNSNVNNGYNSPTDFYSSSNQYDYPFVELKQLPNSKFVSQVKNTTLGVIKWQDFKYQGYTIALNGFGLIGFKKTARSSWYAGNSSKKTWNVTEIDPLKRGATTRSYSKLLDVNETLSFDTSYTEGLLNKVENTYLESTDANTHRYVILLNTQTSTDFLTNVITQKEFQYTNDYFLPKEVLTTYFLGTQSQGTTKVVTQFENNPVVDNYYIGRPKQIRTENNAYQNVKKTVEDFFYDNNNIEHTEKKANDCEETLIESFQYFPNGNLMNKTISVDGGNSDRQVASRTTSYTYDPTNRFIATTTSPDGLVSTNVSYDPVYGLVTMQVDPFGLTTKYVYDSWGKRIEIEDYLGKKITYSYQRIGNSYQTNENSEDGSASIVVTDPLGRINLKGAKDINGNWNYSAIEYDFLGRKLRESEPYAQGSTPNQWITYTYDDYDRVINTHYYTGRNIKTDYIGLTASTTDGFITKTTTKNAIGHVISSSDDPGGTINYTYDANGNLLQSNYDGIVLTMIYDEWDRKLSLNDPSAGLYSYSYDYFGQVLKEITPKGTTDYEYDEFGKISMKHIYGTASDDNTYIKTKYYYDSTTNLVNNITVSNPNDGDSQYVYEYDGFTKKLVNYSEFLPEAIFHKEYDYDDFGRVETEKITASSNGKQTEKTIKNVYKNGELWKILDNLDNKELWKLNTVTPKGQLLTATLGNDMIIHNHYDEFNYLDQTRHYKDDVYALNLETKFDPIRSNLLERNNKNFNYYETFQYDQQDRLTTISKEGVELLNANFSTSNEGFTYHGLPEGFANFNNQKLNVQALGVNAGIKKVIYENGNAGETLSINGKLIKTSGEATISAKIRELDSSNQQVLTEIILGEVGNGNFEFQYTITQNAVIELSFENDEVINPTGSPTYISVGTGEPITTWSLFNLDDIRVVTLLYEEQKYDERGRITDNLSSGSYQYSDDDHPYRVTRVELSENAIPYFDTNKDLKVLYNAFKSPVSINNSGLSRIDFGYNTQQQRSIMYYGSNDEDKTLRPYRRYYSADGSMEIDYDSNTNEVIFTTYIGGDAYSAPIIVRNDGSDESHCHYYYLHRDYLGSILAVSNEFGQVEEQRLFGAWGNILKVKDYNGNISDELRFFDRGYTGHEHLESVGLIHMNGRLYDPVVRRFLQPDNFVQDPYNTQNYNRYSYVLNNPLKYTDINGEEYGLGTAVLIGAIIAATTYTITAMYADVPFTVKGLITTVAISVVSSAVTFGIGEAVNTIGNFYAAASVSAVAHGTFQGGMTAAQGGKFWSGFAAGAISSIASSAWGGGDTTETSYQANNNLSGGKFVTEVYSHQGISGALRLKNTFGMIAFGTVSGGAGAALTGGNFWQGAVTGLVVSGLNHAFHDGDGEGDQGGPPKKKFYFMGDKFENAQFQKDIQAGNIDPAIAYENFMYYANMGLTFAGGMFPASKMFSFGNKSLLVGEYTITKTVASNLATRPYINSPLTIKSIMSVSKGAKDMSFKGGMNYKAYGYFNNSYGIYELGINPETKVIYHFVFKSIKP